MTAQVVDHPSLQPTREHQTRTQTPIEPRAPLPANMDSPGAASSTRAPRAARWQSGAHLAIGMVSLFVLLMLAVLAIFSVPSATLFTIDVGIALAVVTLALSGLLALARS
ncbi:MAG TPA: hypothetical protein VF120_04715 [Ktedonobacterales bacterium]